MQATVNPVYYFTISFDPFPGMHFDIPVSSHRAPITIEALVNSLYSFFQLPLTQHAVLRLGEGQRAHVDQAFYRRVGPPGSDPYASNGGHKMIDLLLDDFIFHGLAPGVHNNLPQWRLVLEREAWGFLYEVALDSAKYPPPRKSMS